MITFLKSLARRYRRLVDEEHIIKALTDETHYLNGIIANLEEQLVTHTLSTAAFDVLFERRRQLDVLGWTPEHDDLENDSFQLSAAACCYANPGWGGPTTHGAGTPPVGWPASWHVSWWKPSLDHRKNLVKAGALILAEIERIDRMAGL